MTKKLMVATVVGLMAVGGLAAGGYEVVAQTTRVIAVEPMTVSTGYRASKVIGATVVNDQNETVGKIDDLLIRSDDRVLVAIVSVGGFLGIGDRLVAVPYDAVTWRSDKAMLQGASKDRLKTFPEFVYPKTS